MNLQTKTTNQVAVKKDNGKRNFFQKTVILLVILAFTSFGFKAKAQMTTLTITSNVSSLDDWMIVFVDANGNWLNQYYCQGGSGLVNSSCIPTAAIDHITMHYIPGGCSVYSFGSGASWPYTAVLPSCGGTTSIDVQGGTATRDCFASPPVGNFNITININ